MPAGIYQLRYKKSVDKDLRKLTAAIRKQIIEKVLALALEPRSTGSVKLRGSVDLYRVRHADYRIIYQINDTEFIVLVVKVGHRKEVYKSP